MEQNNDATVPNLHVDKAPQELVFVSRYFNLSPSARWLDSKRDLLLACVSVSFITIFSTNPNVARNLNEESLKAENSRSIFAIEKLRRKMIRANRPGLICLRLQTRCPSFIISAIV
jgi:hypothetical protein